MSFDVVGRSVSRPGLLNKRTTATCAKRMIDIDPTHADEYKAIIARLNRKQPADYQVTASHTHYFRGGYSLHVRPSITLTYVYEATRTKCEYGNKENLKALLSCPTDVPILRKLEMNTLTSSRYGTGAIFRYNCSSAGKSTNGPESMGCVRNFHIRRRFRQHLWSYSIRLWTILK